MIKIKRFDNLWLMGLILSASMLGVIYLLKIFFPQFVIEVAQIDSITRIGHYIDTHKWAWYLANTIIALFIYFLLAFTVCQRFKLNKKEILFVLATIFVVELTREFLPMQYLVFNCSSLIFLPLILKGDFKITAIWFLTTNLVQSFTLEIRGLAYMISNFNSATSIVLMIDLYIWQVLLCLLFNKNKEK